jgi:hypothetical protein
VLQHFRFHRQQTLVPTCPISALTDIDDETIRKYSEPHGAQREIENCPLHGFPRHRKHRSRPDSDSEASFEAEGNGPYLT